MLNSIARAGVNRVLRPLGTTLGRWGVSPDAVTLVGTLGVVIGAVGFVTHGALLAGLIIIVLSAFTDMIDGAIARATNRKSKWGAFFDSTMDRVADGAIFGSLAYWLAREHRWSALAAALACVLSGFLVSYAKARAEGLGLRCDVGIAERTERLIVLGLGAIGAICGLPLAIDVALWVLTVLAVITIGQRIATVWRQTHEKPLESSPESSGLGA